MNPGATSRRTQSLPGTKIQAKIVLIGDGGVGKTTFRRAWLGEGIKTEYLMTIGADFASQEVTYYHSPTKTTYDVKFQVWDLAGQPRFKAVRDLYYRGAVGALCVFDVTNQESYMHLVEWIQSYWNLNGIGKTPLLIVGNKCDLRENPEFPQQVSAHYGKEYAAELSKLLKDKAGFSIHYIETSAKERINVDGAFKLLASEIISSYGGGSTPYIYVFPYPKRPPAGSAEAHLLPKRQPPEEGSDEIPVDPPLPAETGDRECVQGKKKELPHKEEKKNEENEKGK